jgi:hypothetical protein
MRRSLIPFLCAVAVSGCALKQSQLTLRYPSDPVAGVRVYKPGLNGYADDLIRWTNYYTDKLKLERAELIFQQLPNRWCGLALPPAHPGQVLIAYDLSSWCKISWNPRDAALHEVCHFKLGHTTSARSEAIDSGIKHVEVDHCMGRNR